MQLSHIMYRPLTPLRLCFYSAWTQMDMLSTYKIRESPRSVCLIAFLKKKSVFHGVAAGNDATFTFNLDSWWKHHLDLNYPARFFFSFPSCSFLQLKGSKWLLIDFFLSLKALQADVRSRTQRRLCHCILSIPIILSTLHTLSSFLADGEKALMAHAKLFCIYTPKYTNR